MTYCCNGFANMVKCAGERGNAIIVTKDSTGEFCFLLQSRGLAFRDEQKLDRLQIDGDLIINISAEIGVRYCPFCGCLLERLAAEHRKFYEDLVKEHRKFFRAGQGH